MEDPDNVGESERKITKKCCVLGGRGFIGRALVDMLLKEEKTNWIVRIADRYRESCTAESPIIADAIASGRASYLNLDPRLPYKSQVIQAFQGVSVVFYIDGVDVWRTDFSSCYQIIVQGAKDVISACRQCKVKQLIYNSSADVVFDDAHDIHGGDESLPYSGQYWDMVSDLRAQAEALILSSNDVNGLLTCALRPCNVFGPGDKLVPMLVNVVKSNWAKEVETVLQTSSLLLTLPMPTSVPKSLLVHRWFLHLERCFSLLIWIPWNSGSLHRFCCGV